MTTLRAAFLAATLLLAVPLSLAASSHATQDDAGDETVSPIGLLPQDVEGISMPDCDAPAADIRSVSVTNDGATLTLSMELASLEGLRYECNAVASLISDGDRAAYLVELAEVFDETTGVNAAGVYASARTTGFGLDGCASLGFEDGAYAECVGTFSTSGATLTWSLPVSGFVLAHVPDRVGLTTSTEERTYDLAGRTFDLRANAEIVDAGVVFLQSPGLRIHDFAGADDVPL